MECQGNVTPVKYISVLQEGLLPMFSSVGLMMDEFLFMEDCHTAKITQYWLLQSGI